MGPVFVVVVVVVVVDQIIKVVTFRLLGWCMMGVFLVPTFTRLGHEGQDF